jgi:hypothetical protein
MGNFVAKPPSGGSVSDHDRAVLQLKLQRDKLHQYSKKVGIE